MARGNDERHNPNRRPVNPKMAQTDSDYEPTFEDELEYMDRTGIDPMTGLPIGENQFNDGKNKS